MTRAFLLLLAVLGAVALAQTAPTPVDTSAKQAGRTKETLVYGDGGAASFTIMPTFTLTLGDGGTSVNTSGLWNRRAMEIQNNGPNPIYCRVGAGGDFARMVGNDGGTWSLDISNNIPVHCRTPTLQVTGAATAVTEVR